MKTFLAQTRKAAGTLIAGVYAWWGFVLNSESGPITAAEWYLLGGVGVAVAAVYGLTNQPMPPVLPTYDEAVAAKANGA